MLRELITWVLNTYLGKYLEDFNPAQLSVALLSGQVELENVPIRKDSLRGFGLPLQAISGNIGKIKLQIPVRQFRTAPWCIIIEGVHAVIGPKDLNDWDDEKEKQSDLEYKLSQLDDVEAKWRATKGDSCESNYYASSYSSWLSYGTGLATNICENLQLKINGVHIRYEDTVTIPNFSFVTGITIESLTAHTCDANWQQNSTTSWNQEVAFKLVELKAFAIYWDRLVPENTCRDMQSSELGNLMEKVCSCREHRYIISPISATAHCRHDRSPMPLRTRNRPRLSCEVTVTEVNICLSDLQYTQMVDCVRGLQVISKIRAYRVLRPSNSVRGHTKDWWQYAVRCHGFFFETSQQKWAKARENIRYIKMYTKILLNPNENLSPEDKQFKSDVEKSRDLDDLRTLREVCFLQLVTSELDLKGQDGNQGRSMLFQWFPNWWGWYGNSSATSPASETNGELMPAIDTAHSLEDEILNALEGSVENNSLLKRDAVFGKFDFSLAGGQLNVCSENHTSAEVKPMMEMNFDNLNLNVETRPRSGSHLIGLSLGSVCVKDLFTPNTEFPELIKPQTKDDPQVPPAFTRFQNVKGQKKDTEIKSDSSEPWFLLQYEKKPLAFNTDYRLAVKTRCLDVVYNMEALKWLTEFFTNPLQNANARRRLERMKQSTKMTLIKNWKSIIEGDLGQRKSWCLEIDISAPQIIFVENFTKKNTSIVLVDFGRFQLSKNSTENRIRHQNQVKTDQIPAGTEQINGQVFNMESEEDEAFMTPCSTPPGSENSPSDSATLLSAAPDLSDIVINNETGLEDALHDRIYDKYTIDMTDLQVLVCKGKERWGFASVKGSSALHLLDRFSISLQLERRVVHTVDPEYPSLTLFGTLPKLVAHVNEHKISALMDILAIISADSSPTTAEVQISPDNSPTFNLDDDSISLDESTNSTHQQLQQSNLIMLQFVIDQMSLEVQSRGRSIAELQVSGVRAGLSKRPEDTNISLSVHGLLLVDAIQSFGPDFELLVASHRHVGMDSVSGSLKQSEPCSPTSPASPDPLDNRRPTSPLTISKAISSLQRANSATWSTLGDLDALITVEINFINSTPDTEPLQIANINFNNLDIIANQETIVELLGFVNRVVPSKKFKPSAPTTVSKDVETDANATRPTSIDLMRRQQLQRQFTETRLGAAGGVGANTTNAITSIRTEITFDFHRLNVLVLRALKRDSYMVGRKVGTFTMSEAKIHATLGQEISVDGSLGGLQILDLTPEGVYHQRIFSVGKDPLTDPPDMRRDLLNSLTQEVYGYSIGKDKIIEQTQALSFSVSRDVTATVSVKIRMASVWYTHCARFVQEISWCAKEFKHYLKNFARSIREKATDMAIGLVQPLNDPVEIFVDTPLDEKRPKLFPSPHKVKKQSKKVKLKLDVILDTPVLVVPRSSCSTQVLVAHLGKITVTNNQEELRLPQTCPTEGDKKDDDDIFDIDEVDFQRYDPPVGNSASEIVRICDKYSIEIRNMNLFSLDTSRRKGFRLSALPRAEEFYSCQTDAVAILHDTVIQLQVKKFFEEFHSPLDLSQDQRDEEDLSIDGSVTQPLQISLSRRQYEQLLETVDNVFKIPNDLVRPPAEVSVEAINLETDTNSSPFELNNRLPDKMFQKDNLDNQPKEITPKISFSLPIFIIQLKNEHDNPLIEITFREFSVQYDKASQYETVVQVMLRSILMEDLKCPIDSKYRQMVVSSAQEDRTCRPVNAPSSSCPDLVRMALKDDIPTGSLPENLESSAGFDCNIGTIPTTTLNAINYHRSRLQVDANTTYCPGTPPPSPQSKAHEDNLVIYSALLIDPKCPTLATNYQNRRQTSSIDFNCLNLIISVERWFMLLDFFGLVSEEEDDGATKDGAEEQITEVPSNENNELEITVRSLNLVFVRNESELAKANVSNAFFVVAKYDATKTVEGRLGSVSLYDLTNYGKIYREKFLTSGSEALKFIYKRQDDKEKQRSLAKDATLKIQMSSVRYVHTKRFVMEIQAFIKEFLQLQTPVMKKIKLSDRATSNSQRPTQLGLEISAGSPIVLLPLSFESNRVIVADLGEFTLTNSFHMASEDHVISKKSDQSLMDEILDVMQIHLVNTNLFTGDRVSKCQELQRTENDADICLDMGSFWALKSGNSIFKEKCHLKLQVERNMDSGSSHNCPDVSVQGTLSRLSGVLNLQQYKLLRGFLAYNLGENIDDIYNSFSFSLAESRMNITSMEQVQQLTSIPDKIVWNCLSINLDLEDVSILLNSRTDDRRLSDDQPLACINFIKSCLKIDSFSDSSQDIDLVSQEILVTDSRFHGTGSEAPKNVFTNILQPIRAEVGSNIVQAEVHSRQRKDQAKFTILLNNMRVMAILDWIENVQDYLSQDADPPSSGSMMRTKNAEVSQSSSTLDEAEKTPMEVILNITDSELVFVEKTDEKDTNAIILKSTTVLTFKPMDLIRPISVNLNHLEVFSCMLGCENETALSIIDPITVNVDLRENTIDIQIQKQLCIRLSYHDVKMFIRMMESLPKQTRTAQKKRTALHRESVYSMPDVVLIAPLMAMGFKRAECVRALEMCKNQLNEAALWLTQQRANRQPTMEVHSVVVNAQCISVCVIDDCMDADVPLLELSLSQLKFNQLLNERLATLPSYYHPLRIPVFCSGQLEAVIASDYYNRHLSGWEPVIEPWECTANWNYSTGQTNNESNLLNLSIMSKQMLKVNITTTLIELWHLVRNNWTQDYYEGTTNNAIATKNANANDSPTNYRRRAPFVPFSLKNDTGQTLTFQILLTQPGGITRTEVTSHDMISAWIQVQPNETVPFGFGPQTKLRHMDSHKQNLHQILVKVQGWAQVGPVSIDRVGIFFRHALQDDSPSEKARIVFDVSLVGSAQKLITVRSALRLINRLDTKILLKLDQETAVVEPSKCFSVPLSRVRSDIFFMPMFELTPEDERNGNALERTKAAPRDSNLNHQLNEYFFQQTVASTRNGNRQFSLCDEGISWSKCVEDIIQEPRICRANRDKVFNVVATIKRDGYPHRDGVPGHTIMLIPPLRITNLLCCDLLYKISGQMQEKTTSHTQGRINSSTTANIYEVSLEEAISLSITLDNYKVSGQLKIPVGHSGIVEPKLKLLDINNRDLHLRASIQAIKGNGMEIFISAPFWLVNRTGLPLVFRQEGVSQPASGQFEENEMARVVTPLMFSFSDPEASPCLEVRLGERYGTNNPWCQSFSLHKEIVYRQLKAANSNDSFAIGVEVRRGRGRYSRTSVVTFSPRFQLYNRSSQKLQFAQKCHVIKPVDLESRNTYIDAVPGCHFPFHWPRSDQEPLLCVRMADVDCCHWSSGIPINEAQSVYINIRNDMGDMRFLRLEVILQGSTYFLLFGDAHALPPPIRLDNFSEVPIKFFQYGCKPEWRTTVRPHSSLSYALDDPIGHQLLQIEAPGGNSIEIPLRNLSCSEGLTYSNFIYLAFKGTFQTPSVSENLYLSSEFDIESQHLVLGVKNSKVILMRKHAGDRSQLWLMNKLGQLEHEGSSPPSDPGRSSTHSVTRMVLDLEKAPNPNDYTNLCVRAPNTQRQTTQTWKFENGRLMCHANMCVQARNGVFGLRPGSDAVLGRIESETRTLNDVQVPIEQNIERQKLRPGSGQLDVKISMDGPIKTIQIIDVKNPTSSSLTPDPQWKHASAVKIKSNRGFREKDQKSRFVDELSVKVDLEKGVGLSVISRQPCEELTYITLQTITIEALATPSVRSIDLRVNTLQIDNQLLDTNCPIVLYTIKPNVGASSPAPSNAIENGNPNALTFSAKVLSSPNKNAVIVEYLIFDLRPCVVFLEERLILKMAMFLGLGSSHHSATSLADESEYEAHQVEKRILASNAKRYYFENLYIESTHIRLSVITASKLPPQLSEMKRKLGLTLIKFEDALIEFHHFTDRHHFETLEMYLRAIKSHYKNQIKWHAASILGSVDFLGNPLGFANDLSEGVSGLIFEGSVKSLVKNVTHGISNSTAKLTETISDGLGRVVLNEQDTETRQRILEVPTGSNTSGEHLAAGLKGLGFGLLGGVTSIVRHTYEGVQNDGFQGFISGLGKGIVGTVTKPIIGVLDLASETASAVRETSKSAHRVLPERKRPPRCVTGAPGGLLPPYSYRQSKGQQYLYLINRRNFSEQLMSYEQDLCNDRDAKLRLLVSTEYIRLFSRTEEEPTVMLECHLDEVLSCHPVTAQSSHNSKAKPHYYIEISKNLEQIRRPRVRCQSEEMAEKAARSINYAKSVYDEREHTLSYQSSLNEN